MTGSTALLHPPLAHTHAHAHAHAGASASASAHAYPLHPPSTSCGAGAHHDEAPSIFWLHTCVSH
eukprot:323029-Chlamydomonas_euryale.AAC.1